MGHTHTPQTPTHPPIPTNDHLHRFAQRVLMVDLDVRLDGVRADGADVTQRAGVWLVVNVRHHVSVENNK